MRAAPLDLYDASALCLAPPPGRMAGIFGEDACALALRALAAPLLAGETVVAVDAGNRFDPYAISRSASALGGDARAALSRIRLSRAFTCHQLERLLSERLAPELSRRRARLALVLGLHESFRDADVPYREACALFRKSVAALRKIATSGVRVVLASHPASGDRAGFFMHLAREARPMLLVRREGGAWGGTLWLDEKRAPIPLLSGK
ncbi:MAG TPA: hypothetical protein VGK27_06375 [Candidatus Deferrimicrobiaceae bacterium]|jgi:hypothetical protein